MKYTVFFTLLLLGLAYAYHVETIKENNEMWKNRLISAEKHALDKGISLGEISCLQNCEEQKLAEYSRGYQIGKVEITNAYEPRLKELQLELNQQTQRYKDKLMELDIQHAAEIRDTVATLIYISAQQLQQAQHYVDSLERVIQQYQQHIDVVTSKSIRLPSPEFRLTILIILMGIIGIPFMISLYRRKKISY